MRFKSESRPLANFEPFALTDIILNVFIFFFISFSFLATFDKSREGQVDVALPKTVSASPPTENKRLTVSLTKEGGLYLQAQPITLQQLEAQFKAEKAEGANITVVVRADSEVTHGRVVEVMDLARIEGLDRLAIATKTR